MAIKKFTPQNSDLFLGKEQGDHTLGKFGHLNYILRELNNIPSVTGSPGGIFYANPNGAPITDGNLYWDATNARLGINNPIPTQALDVMGSIKTYGLYVNTALIQTSGSPAAGFGMWFNTNPGYYNALAFNAPGQSGADNSIKFVFALNSRNWLFNNNSTTDFFITTATGKSILLGVGQTSHVTKFGNGNVAIGTNAVDAGYKFDVNGTARIQNKLSVGTPTAASAVMEVTSTTQGFLPPRMTGAQVLAISSPAEGLMVYATSASGAITSKGWWGYDGSAWVKLN